MYATQATRLNGLTQRFSVVCSLEVEDLDVVDLRNLEQTALVQSVDQELRQDIEVVEIVGRRVKTVDVSENIECEQRLSCATQSQRQELTHWVQEATEFLGKLG